MAKNKQAAVRKQNLEEYFEGLLIIPECLLENYI